MVDAGAVPTGRDSRYPSRVVTKKIFLASSAELVEDRQAFELMKKGESIRTVLLLG